MESGNVSVSISGCSHGSGRNGTISVAGNCPASKGLCEHKTLIIETQNNYSKAGLLADLFPPEQKLWTPIPGVRIEPCADNPLEWTVFVDTPVEPFPSSLCSASIIWWLAHHWLLLAAH